MSRPQDPRATQAPRPKKAFNWPKFLIESAIAIVVFNIIAGFIAYYFIIPRLKH